MIRITRARMQFQGFGGSPERASEISQRALREVAQHAAPAARANARANVQLTVRVPHGASDAAIASRVAAAIRRRLGRGTGT
jgi:hypothetical protein